MEPSDSDIELRSKLTNDDIIFAAIFIEDQQQNIIKISNKKQTS